MLRAQIYEDVKTSMKAQDRERLNVVRYLWSEIKRVEIDAKHKLSDDEVVDLLRKEIKRRNDALSQMKQASREDMVEEEEKQLRIIETYVPALLNQEEVEAIVTRINSQGNHNFGSLMKEVMREVKGKADGRLVQDVVKSALL